MNIEEVFDKTNWHLLRCQKERLMEILSAVKEDEYLTGLLNWIDEVQDAALLLGYPVFGDEG